MHIILIIGAFFCNTLFAAFFQVCIYQGSDHLSEDPVDGETIGAGELSQLMTDLIGTQYDWSLLNVNGEHGGNIFTTTLPNPAAT